MKICTKCKEEKELSEFPKRKSRGKDKSKVFTGSYCHQCRRESDRLKRLNPEFMANERKRAIKYYNDNKEDRLEYSSKYKDKNREEVRRYSREYRKIHRVSLMIKDKKYREENREHVLEVDRKWQRNRRKTDPLYDMTCRLRCRSTNAFAKSRWNKNTKTAEMLGCDFKTAFNHIESQFVDGMSWENRSEWHIDHKKPLALATTEQELIELCHYTNLQPLWAIDNLRKSDKWEE